MSKDHNRDWMEKLVGNHEDDKDYSYEVTFLPDDIKKKILELEVPPERLTAHDVKTGDAKIRAMHPLKSTELSETLPFLCRCACDCRSKKQIKMERIDKENTMEDIDKMEEKLKTIIKSYKGKYKGSSFNYDSRKAAGLVNKKKPSQEQVPDEEPEEDLEEGEVGSTDAEEK